VPAQASVRHEVDLLVGPGALDLAARQRQPRTVPGPVCVTSPSVARAPHGGGSSSRGEVAQAACARSRAERSRGVMSQGRAIVDGCRLAVTRKPRPR